MLKSLSKVRFLLFVILFCCLQPVATSQISGHGYLDGVYPFTIELRESNDSFMEGEIQFDGESKANQLIATTRNDTLRCQEIDEFINPVSTFLLIKRNDTYYGEWFDEKNKSILPATLFLSSDAKPPTMFANRFIIDDSTAERQVLYQVPLSPTVQVGKYIIPQENRILPFSSYTSFEATTYYSTKGIIDVVKEDRPQEEIPIELYFFNSSSFSIEALIPSFSETFVDSLQSVLVRWKEKLEQRTLPVNTQRFPSRFYAICDIDFWVDDFLSGSFEYVSPSGEGTGFTFVFDRKDDKFIEFDKLIRSGSLDESQSDEDENLGISFNHYGIIYKDKFNAIEGRSNRHIAWKDLDIRLKRKLNDYIK